jgi:hypothetical protein
MSSYFKAAKQAAADASKRAADMSKKAADYSSKKAAAAAAMTQEMTLLKKKRPTGDEERWDGGAPPDSPAGPTIGLNDLLNGGTPVGGPAREDGAQVVQMHAVDSPPSMATPSVDDDSRAKENGEGDARRPRDAARYPDGPMALRARQENETTGMTQPSSAENHGTSERERALEERLSRLTAEREKSVADSAAAEARAARAEARAEAAESEANAARVAAGGLAHQLAPRPDQPVRAPGAVEAGGGEPRLGAEQVPLQLVPSRLPPRASLGFVHRREARARGVRAGHAHAVALRLTVLLALLSNSSVLVVIGIVIGIVPELIRVVVRVRSLVGVFLSVS